MYERLSGVFRLNANTFEEIEHDESATSQAAIIVAVVALLGALGSGFLASTGQGNFLTSFLSTLVWTFLGWIIWSVVTYFVGTTFFRGQATIGEMMRVIGFAFAPQVLSIIPCIGGLVGAIWSLIAGFVAVRQGLDLDDLKAALTIIIGFLVYFLGSLLIASLFAGVGSLLS
jgi:hypothetical protein